MTNFEMATIQHQGEGHMSGRYYFGRGVLAFFSLTFSVLFVLRPLFGDRLISRFADTPWPPRSPDLSICDYFLWGYLKARVYEHKPRTLENLKEAIRVEVAQIDRAMLERVEANFQERLQKCIKRTPHERYCFPNINLSNANSMGTQ